MSDATNPLLDLSGLPRYQEIRPEQVEPAVRQRISEAEARVEELMARGGPYDWASLIEPLDAATEALSRAWGPVEHLNAVKNNEALREVYNRTRPLLTEHSAKLGQDERLHAAYQQVADAAEAAGLDAAQRKVLADALRDFRLAGVALPAEQKARYREIQVELAKLQSRFSDNVLDATNAYRLVITDPADLAGLPESVVAEARAQAERDAAEAARQAASTGETGASGDVAPPEVPANRWVFTLHAPSVTPFLQYQQNRALREELYRAYVTRASSGALDNTPVIRRILELRQELAALLGFRNYAEVSLATKMAESPEQVLGFLEDLAARSRPFGLEEARELGEFARARDGVERLEAWDVAFYREALRQERYSFSDEEVRQYFPLERALQGLFQLLQRLYGLRLRDVGGDLGLQAWDPGVIALEVAEESGALCGHLLLDLFARDGKRGGAWMGECIERKATGGRVQHPVAYLVCNFAAPVGGKPALLRHSEVRTLFHETGHALHHVLTRVDYRQCSGINAVPWDGVELPSQFHENWVWERDCLDFLAAHWETGQKLPQALLDKMLAARNFMSGADMLRQLEFGLFDLSLHASYDPRGERSPHDVLGAVRERVAVFPRPDYDRFENGFLHIFSGGYAAGYYSYKWAELLAADAYARFEEEGIFSRQAGQAFRDHILAMGGSRDLMELFVAFRGRKPTPEALLRHSGLVRS